MFQSKKPNSSRGTRKFRLRTDASRDTQCSRTLNTQLPPRNCWTRYPPRYSNGWVEFWSEPMKLFVDKLNHAHWLRIDPPGLLYSDQKFYTQTSHSSGPYALCRESHFQFPWNWVKYSATNIGQIVIHQFILETWKHSCGSCVINNLPWPMIAGITAATRMDAPEWLSMQSIPVWLLAQLIVGLRDHTKLHGSQSTLWLKTRELSIFPQSTVHGFQSPSGN